MRRIKKLENYYATPALEDVAGTIAGAAVATVGDAEAVKRAEELAEGLLAAGGAIKGHRDEEAAKKAAKEEATTATEGLTPLTDEQEAAAVAAQHSDDDGVRLSDEDMQGCANMVAEALTKAFVSMKVKGNAIPHGKITPTATGVSGGPTKAKAMTVTQPVAATTKTVPAAAKAKANPALEDDQTGLPPDVEDDKVTSPEDGAPANAPVPAATATPPVSEPATPAVPDAAAPAPAADNVPPSPQDGAPAPDAAVTGEAPPPADDAPVNPDGEIPPTEASTEPTAGTDVAPAMPETPPPVPTEPAEGQTQADPAAADLTPDAGDAIVEIDDTDLSSNDEGIADDLVEIQQEGDEPFDDNSENQIQEAEEVAEALESLYYTLEDSLSKGGISKISSDILAVSLEHMYMRVGIRQSSAFVSLESITENTNAKDAELVTKLAMEDIKSSVGKIKNSIIKALRTTLETISRYFRRRYLTFKKIDNRAKKLLTTINSAKGTATETVFSHKRLAKALAIGDGVPTNFSGESKEFASVTKEVFSNFLETGFGPTVTNFKNIIAKETKEEFLNAIEFKINRKVFTQTPDKNKVDYDSIPPKGFTLLSSHVLFGNRAIVGVMPEDNCPGAEIFNNLDSVEISVSKVRTEGNPITQLKVLNLQEAKEVVQDVISICTYVAFGEKEWYRLEALLESNINELQKYVSYGEQIGGTVGTIAGAVGGLALGNRIKEETGFNTGVYSVAAGTAAGAAAGKAIGNKLSKAFGGKGTSSFISEMRSLLTFTEWLSAGTSYSFFEPCMTTSNALLDYAESSLRLHK
jgi:hypothetical protein